MAENYRRSFPAGTKRITTGCQYCAVGCGYNAFLIPEGASHDDEVAPMDGVSRFITPAMRNRVLFKGLPHDVAVAPDVRCDLNKGNHSVRGGSQGENLVTRDGAGRSTEDRLKSPLVRVRADGEVKLVEISWAQLNRLVARLVRQAAGMAPEDGKIRVNRPEGLGVKMFEYQYLENTYALTKLFYSAIGTPNLAYHDRPSAAGSSPGLADAGLRPHDFSYDEVLDCHVLVFIGTNPYENQSVFFMQHCVGKQMVVIDPRKTATARYAEESGGIHVQPRFLGADSLVLYAMARQILTDWAGDLTGSERQARLAEFPWRHLIADGSQKAKFKKRRHSRALTLEEFDKFLTEEPDLYTLEQAEKAAKIEQGLLRKVVDLLFDPAKAAAAQPKVGIFYEKGMIWGFNYHNTASLASLGLLLGAYSEPGRFVGRVGGHQKGWAESRKDLKSIFISERAENPERRYDEGYPFRNSTDHYVDEHLANAGFPDGIKPRHNIDNHVFGPDVAAGPEERVKLPNKLTTNRKPDVRLLWIIGGNYLGQTNDSQRKLVELDERRKLGGPGDSVHLPTSVDDIEAVAKVFEERIAADGIVLIQQDLFKNPTTERCDIVIPAAGWGEDSFCRYNAQRRLKLYDRFQDPPLQKNDAQRITGDPADAMDDFDAYQHSPKPDWRIIRDIAREIGAQIDSQPNAEGFQEALTKEFYWKDSAQVADDMAQWSNRGLAGSDEHGNSLLGDLYLYGRFKPDGVLDPERGILHQVLGARPHEESGNPGDPVNDARAPLLSEEFYSVQGSSSKIYGNTIASNGVILPVRGLDSNQQPVSQPVKNDQGTPDPQLIEARGKQIQEIRGRLRRSLTPGTANFVKAPWSEISAAFKDLQPADGELVITNGRFNHLWNNLFHHLRNEYVNERYPEDMPGTILEVNPEWASSQQIDNGDIVEVTSNGHSFKAVASLQQSIAPRAAFAMFSYPVRNPEGEFQFTGYTNNITHGYADGINPIAALKYSKGAVRKLGHYQSANRLGPSYEARNQIQRPLQPVTHRLEWEMRELIVTKGLPRAFRHTKSGKPHQEGNRFLTPDQFLEDLRKAYGGDKHQQFEAYARSVMKWHLGSTLLIDQWHEPEIGLASRWLKVIQEIVLLPPFAIGRFGSSPEPLDNYELMPPEEGNPTGYRGIRGLPTFEVRDGRIETVRDPAQIDFKDGAGRVKPVAPFFEVWALFEGRDEFVPLTAEHLSAPEALSWQVELGNWKVFRRTGEEEDKVSADSGAFSHHDRVALPGHCLNFSDGKSIPMGTVQYIRPQGDHKEIRLRFTPPAGKVFGHRLDANVITTPEQTVYDSVKGKWDTYPELDPVNDPPGEPDWPPSTIPGGIYAQQRLPDGSVGSNLGYLDDSSDGIITVRLLLPARDEPLTATARIAVGPPDFAPDSLHLRSLQDDLLQAAEFTAGAGEEVRADDVIGIVRRALETVRLMNPAVMNQAFSGTTGRPPAYSFPISHSLARTVHSNLVAELQKLKQAPDSQEFRDGLNKLGDVLVRLRHFDQAADASDIGRRRMPAMMRGSDGLDLALTRRQISLIERFHARHSDQPQPEPQPGQLSAEERAMVALIEHFAAQGAAPFHFGIPGLQAGENLGSLFSEPRQVLELLTTRNATTGPSSGQPLVRPGEPTESAFFQLINGANPIMNNRFTNYRDPDTNRNGIEVVRDWIQSLT